MLNNSRASLRGNARFYGNGKHYPQINDVSIQMCRFRTRLLPANRVCATKFQDKDIRI